jgi:hypothetical protein
MRLLAVAVDQRLDLLVRRARARAVLDRQAEHRDRRRALSESTTRTLSPTLGRGVRALVGARQRGEMCSE